MRRWRDTRFEPRFSSFPFVLAGWLALTCLATPARALAGPSEDCARAYEQAQEDRAAGRLLSSVDQLEICVAPTCPAFIRSDCGRWLDECERAIPSVMFKPRGSRQGTAQSSASCDGQGIPRPFDGRAIRFDPGRHTCQFRSEGDDRIVTLELTVQEGQRNRLVEVELPEPIAPAALPSAGPRELSSIRPAPVEPIPPPGSLASEQRMSWARLPVAIGVAGLGGFAVFALMGQAQEHSLSTRCAPTCPDSDVASVRLKYRLADASLGVALVAAGIATYLLLPRRAGSDEGARAARTGARAATISFEPRIFSHGAGAGVNGSF